MHLYDKKPWNSACSLHASNQEIFEHCGHFRWSHKKNSWEKYPTYFNESLVSLDNVLSLLLTQLMLMNCTWLAKATSRLTAFFTVWSTFLVSIQYYVVTNTFMLDSWQSCHLVTGEMGKVLKWSTVAPLLLPSSAKRPGKLSPSGSITMVTWGPWYGGCHSL